MDIQNPFNELPLAAEGTSDINRYRVDREQELRECVDAVTKMSNNVLIYGEKGIGKTFLLKLLKDSINKESDIFSFNMDLMSLRSYALNDEENAHAFPRAILLQACLAIWKELIKKDYFKLDDYAKGIRHFSIFEKTSSKIIKKIYASLLPSLLKHKTEKANSIDFSGLASPSLSEKYISEIERMGVLPFEYIEYAELLLKDVLPGFGKKRLVVLCDEANLLPLSQQQGILERYLEIFLSKNIQFVFVAGYWNWSSLDYMPTAFETTVQLEGFHDVNDIKKLVSLVTNGSKVNIHDALLNQIHSEFSGHPRRMIMTLSRAVDMVLHEGGTDPLEHHINMAINKTNKVYEQAKRHEEKASNKLIQRDF